ncbi:hypothetical protein [Staphylococcus caprae]|uniref:hypothetical protein n=2 Tax=Staphylococcus caprae TaxID=29380 RepID=UPI003B20F7C0
MSLKKGMVASTSLAIVLGFSSESFADAQEIHNQNNQGSQQEEKVDRVANVLKVYNEHEDAIVYDDTNQTAKVKASVLQQEMPTKEYNEVITDLDKEGMVANETTNYHRGLGEGIPDNRTKNQKKRKSYIDDCAGNELSKTYGKKAANAVKKIVLSKDYKKAAKKLVKRGVKSGNIVYTLGKILYKCTSKGAKKYPKN